jgi:hypothetical protein
MQSVGYAKLLDIQSVGYANGGMAEKLRVGPSAFGRDRNPKGMNSGCLTSITLSIRSEV